MDVKGLAKQLQSIEPGSTPSKLQAKPGESAPHVVYLHPGEMRATAEPLMLTTVLGSCVAVCVWDSALKVGGMAHYLLPKCEPERSEKSARYGDVAIESLLKEMENLNCQAATLQARIFGGACVLQVFRNQGKEHLGERNVEIARRMLRERGVLVLEKDTGGDSALKIAFNTLTGTAVVKRLGEASLGA